MKEAPDPFFVEKGEGSHLYLKNGQKVFDGISSWWVITHGHCHPEISQAIARQAHKLDQVVFANFTHEAAEELVGLLEGFLPNKLNRIFFSDNGSTSVEVAMKMAYQVSVQSGEKQRRKFLAFEKAYHGDTCGAMSVSADGIFTQAYSDLRFEVIRCEQGLLSTDPIESWVGDFLKKISQHEDEIAAVIVEPLLQGAGGMLVWPTEALRQIYRACRERGISIIFDEVMTGFGRTGEMFACEKLDLIPDFLCLSKGLTGGVLPLALTVTTEEVYGGFLSDAPDRMLFHGHSFTGNAISCAAASANLSVFKNEKTLKKITEIEEIHRNALERIRKKVPVRDVRIVGGVGILELEVESAYGGEVSNAIASRCLQEGLFLRPLGNVIYLMPPYGSNKADLNSAWQIVEHVCRERV